MGPVQGMQAAVREAGRRELPDAEAAAMSCLGQPCLDPAAMSGPEENWRAIDPAMPSLPFETTDSGVTAPVSVLAFLHDALGEDVERPIPRSAADATRVEFIVDQDLQGQDSARLGLARNSVVLDDEIGTMWVRWRRIGSGPADAAAHPVPH